MKYWRYYIATIILFAAFLRLLGIWHGYPFSYYGDEAHFVKRALSFGSGDLNPHWFHKPAFFMYILFVEYGVYFVLGKIFGLWSSVEEFAVSFVHNPGPFYLIGRITVTAFSIATIWTVYLIGEKHIKKGAGLVGAIFLALSYAHVAGSQDVKADIPATFFTIISVYFLLNYIDNQKQKNLLLAVVMAGMGTAVKYYPLVMLAPIVFGITIVNGRTFNEILQNWQRIVLISVGSILLLYTVFFICSPYNFIDPLGFNQTFGRMIEA